MMLTRTLHSIMPIKQTDLRVMPVAKTAVIALSVSLSSSVALAADTRTICVYDPLGAYGDIASLAKGYVAKINSDNSDNTKGVKLKPKFYTDETVAKNDFMGSLCDLSLLTGTRAREFNHFTGTIEAVGGMTRYDDFKALLGFMTSPKLTKYLVQGKYEVGGVYPLGSVFLYVNDRKINTAGKLAGKKIGALSHDVAVHTMVKHVGAAPVNVTLTNFGGKFNNGATDVCYGPAMAYDAYELYKGLSNGGGIIRFPLAQMNAQVLFKRDRLPANFGVTSRQIVQSDLGKAFNSAEQKDAKIADKWWVDIPAADKVKYLDMFRDVRVSLAKTGTYHASMLKLMKKIRCKHNPAAAECASNAE